MEIRRLPAERLELIGDIDRSEKLTIGYAVKDGELIASEVDWDVPNWFPTGSGEHSVPHLIAFCRPIVERGGTFLGAFEDDEVLGVAIVEPEFEGTMAWLAFLQVSHPHRRRGVASALWEESVRIAREVGADRMYVSATPSESAVGFYLGKGCVLAAPPHPDLLAEEPEDVHFICPLEG